MSKETVLQLLRTSGDFLSGQMLADELGVSRNTIWKYIKALQTQGYSITSVTNRGYRLDETTDQLNRSEILRLGPLKEDRLKVFDSLPGTNDWIKEHQNELSSGTVVMTSHQSRGRGRQGRSFHSPAHEGIYFSILYKGETTPLPEFVTIGAAVAVARVLEELGFSPDIKWVNDICLDHRKVCGILTEGELELETGRMKYLVLGVGINVNNESFPPELEDVATSLKRVARRFIDPNELAARLLVKMDETIAGLMPSRSRAEYQRWVDEILEEFNRRLYLKGEEVTLQASDRLIRGILTGTDEHGHLVLATPEGLRAFPYGEYRLRISSDRTPDET